VTGDTAPGPTAQPPCRSPPRRGGRTSRLLLPTTPPPRRWNGPTPLGTCNCLPPSIEFSQVPTRRQFGRIAVVFFLPFASLPFPSPKSQRNRFPSFSASPPSRQAAGSTTASIPPPDSRLPIPPRATRSVWRERGGGTSDPLQQAPRARTFPAAGRHVGGAPLQDPAVSPPPSHTKLPFRFPAAERMCHALLGFGYRRRRVLIPEPRIASHAGSCSGTPCRRSSASRRWRRAPTTPTCSASGASTGESSKSLPSSPVPSRPLGASDQSPPGFCSSHSVCLLLSSCCSRVVCSSACRGLGVVCYHYQLCDASRASFFLSLPFF